MKLYVPAAMALAAGFSLIGGQVLGPALRDYRETSPVVVVFTGLLVLMFLGQLALAKRRKR